MFLFDNYKFLSILYKTNDKKGYKMSGIKIDKFTAKRIAEKVAYFGALVGVFFIGRCSKAYNDEHADAKMQKALLVANDSIDVLNTKNDSLQFACDSLASELDDCQSSKVVVAKPAPVKKETKKSPTVAKPSTVKPVAPVKPSNKPQEPVIPQGPKEIESGSTTVNINTPSNIININNGGVINNYIEEQKKAEEQYIKEYNSLSEAYKDGFVPTGRRVRCK